MNFCALSKETRTPPDSWKGRMRSGSSSQAQGEQVLKHKLKKAQLNQMVTKNLVGKTLCARPPTPPQPSPKSLLWSPRTLLWSKECWTTRRLLTDWASPKQLASRWRRDVTRARGLPCSQTRIISSIWKIKSSPAAASSYKLWNKLQNPPSTIRSTTTFKGLLKTIRIIKKDSSWIQIKSPNRLLSKLTSKNLL